MSDKEKDIVNTIFGQGNKIRIINDHGIQLLRKNKEDGTITAYPRHFFDKDGDETINNFELTEILKTFTQKEGRKN